MDWLNLRGMAFYNENDWSNPERHNKGWLVFIIHGGGRPYNCGWILVVIRKVIGSNVDLLLLLSPMGMLTVVQEIGCVQNNQEWR